MSDKLREALMAHEKKVIDMVLSCQKDPTDVYLTSTEVLESRYALLAALADSATAVLDNTPRLQSPQLPDSATTDAPPEPTEEMVTRGLQAAKRWGFRVISPRPDSSATSIFECGEHPRTFIEDILRAALAVQQKGEG